jgi:hypothetical protein
MLIKQNIPVRSIIFCVLGVMSTQTSLSRELTLDDAITLAVDRTSRAEIIRGNLEVAEKNYFAERVNFYLPEISINGNMPAYSINESFRFYGGLPRKQLIKTTDFNFTGNIQLKQSLISGGDLTVRGNLLRGDARYPLWSDLDVTVEQSTRESYFDFEFEQPFLKPSDAKNDLNNKRDDLEIARLAKLEEIADLKKEVTEAYFGVLQLSLKAEFTRDKLESARLKAEVDSVKLRDGVISEENWLESASARLDAELEQFDIDNQLQEKNRELAILLDFDASETILPVAPEIGQHLDERERKTLIECWEESVDVLKAHHEHQKEQRAADYAASAHGLNGNLAAKYSLGRGKVKTEGVEDDDIKANSWEISLNFTYPVWDGGASGAQVKAARLSEEKARIEYERNKSSARAQIVNLINRLDVSYRKLGVLRKQIELSQNRLDIAEFRRDDGQISMITYLESKIDYLEAKDRYLEELKNYLLDKITLEGKYIS